MDSELPEPFAPVGFAWEVLKEKGINRLRVEGAEELLGLGGALIDATASQEIDAAKFLMLAQATRAQHTFEAVIGATRMGRGVQAAMMNRALLDDVLDVHWTAANPDDAPARADEHDRLISLAEHQLEVRFGRTDRHLTEAEEAELQGLIELYGGRGQAFKASWHRASFEDCFALVQQLAAARLSNRLPADSSSLTRRPPAIEPRRSRRALDGLLGSRRRRLLLDDASQSSDSIALSSAPASAGRPATAVDSINSPIYPACQRTPIVLVGARNRLAPATDPDRETGRQEPRLLEPLPFLLCCIQTRTSSRSQ